jgi:hypothetical protein
MSKDRRYVLDTLLWHKATKNSYFKFVIGNPHDFLEFEQDFVKPLRLDECPDRVALMPEAANTFELSQKAKFVAEYCIAHGWRFTDREQVVIWNKTTGV